MPAPYSSPASWTISAPACAPPPHQHYDISLTVDLNGKTIGRSNTHYLYWSMAQQLTHHTSNGCNVRVGDLLASGTISGPGKDQYGSLLEVTRNGETGNFLQDGDTVTISGHAGEGKTRVGFGGVTGTILPARIQP